MADFIFTSPGAKFRERDITFVTRNVGITTLGLVGETVKGPAFEPVLIRDKTEFRERFGGQSIKRFDNGQLQYQLPYAANSYLDESNQLYVTRVLGLSGYDVGKAWAITISAGYDPDTTGETTTVSSTTGFTGSTYLGVPITGKNQSGSAFTGFTKNGDTFEGIRHDFVVNDFNPVTLEGTVNDTEITLTASSYQEYEDMVVAVIRSRGLSLTEINEEPVTTFDTTGLTISNLMDAGTDLFEKFEITATGETRNEKYVVSLNPNSSSFLPNVIGNEPKGKNTMIWVESIYPDLIKKLDADGYGWAVKELVENTINVDDYKTSFKTPETPWVVSQLRGSTIDRLFKFYSISDGDSANREIKISIQNINPITLEFDVIVRDWADNDNNLSVLETFARCTLSEGQNSFIGQRIGTIDGEYDLKSKYIVVELADDINPTSFPAGFEGYRIKDWTVDGAVNPKIFYKTSYLQNERPRNVYLGISKTAYNATNVLGSGINQNLFNFNGVVSETETGHTYTKGFHMDSGATGNYNGFEFEVGDDAIRTSTDVLNSDNDYFDINKRKFTLVPAGGFDGWDVHRTSRSNTDGFELYGMFDGVDADAGEKPYNDFQAWETAINTFENAEEITINLFATPSINWSDNSVLVKNTIEMIETRRTDSLYVIDSPDINIPQVVGEEKNDVVASTKIVGLLDDADIDSNYACTYFPWIQMRDTQNNVNVYIPPTGEVVKSMAFTDNSSFPWFAPAGLNRGVTNARKSKYKLSQEARDVLYVGRINPMADFAEVGTAIFGQKTLQKAESALDRINVRRLLLQIKVLISNIAIRLLFEQNDQSTIDQFLQKANPVLDTIKRERGLYDFRIKMDDSINTPESMDRNELYGEIFLKPTRSLEYIGITFTITPSGAAFEDFGA